MKQSYKIKLLLIIISIISITISCDSNKSILRADLDLALRLSGENRPELEKVLKHYSKEAKDSLKLKAAKFLISNMIRHYSISGEYIDKHIQTVDSIYAKQPTVIKSIIYTIPTRLNDLQKKVKTEYDLHKITADFLINNIERSFEIWENSPYTPRLSFDDFCEYILPYRVNNEPLISWKDSSMYNYFKLYTLKEYEFDLYSYSQFIDSKALIHRHVSVRDFPDSAFRSYAPDCIDRAYNSVITHRAFGIPAVVDFVPFFPKEENRHYWIANIDRRLAKGTIAIFIDSYSAKVYRKTYSLNPIPEDKTNFIPAFMKDPYNKDVTELYENVTNIKYDFGEVPNHVKYAYLSVFSDLAWREVAWAELKRGKAEFEKMGREVIYLPTYYDKTKQIYAQYPIYIDINGNIKDMIPNREVLQNLHLKRKFTIKKAGEYFGTNLLGFHVEASNDSKLEKQEQIAVIESYKNMEYDTLRINTDKKYKYWSFKNPVGSFAEIAKIEFINEKGETIAGEPFIIDRDNILKENDEQSKLIFDDDLLTYATVRNRIGMRFKEPVSISLIRYISRNDENGIYPGDQYELFYFDKGMWISLGEKTATNYSIDYEQVPTNALFWLRNHTKGEEERPFTVNNGKIRFW